MAPPRLVVLKCPHAAMAELPVIECEVHPGEWIVSLRDIFRASRPDVKGKDAYTSWLRSLRKAPGFKQLRHMEHGKANLWCTLPAAITLMTAPIEPVSKESWVWMGYLHSVEFVQLALAEGLLKEGAGAAEAAEAHAGGAPKKRKRRKEADELPPVTDGEAEGGEALTGLVKKMGARKCTFQGCLKHGSFGWPGGVRARCKMHREEGMIRLSGTRCSEEGCARQASFGWPDQKPLRCRTHKLPGMTDRVSRLCAHPGCPLHPSYGYPGHKPTHCAPHAEPGMENVMSPRCESEGCKKRPSYGWPGQKNSRCKVHKEDGMTDQNHEKRTLYRAMVRQKKDEEQLKLHGVLPTPKKRGRPRKMPTFGMGDTSLEGGLQMEGIEHGDAHLDTPVHHQNADISSLLQRAVDHTLVTGRGVTELLHSVAGVSHFSNAASDVVGLTVSGQGALTS